MLATYSPTIQYAYKRDAKWFEDYIDPNDRHYDKDGYDQFGYDIKGVDRAGHTQYDYQEASIDADIYYDVLMQYAGFDPRSGGE